MAIHLPDFRIRRAPFEFHVADGGSLVGDIRTPLETRVRGTIVFVHGFRAFKDWGPFPYVCESLSSRGFVVISFNFSRNGVIGHGSEITRHDLFRTNTISRELEELRMVLVAIDERRMESLASIGPGGLGILGHSRGGGLAILAVEAVQAVQAVAVWGSVFTFDRMTPRQKERIRQSGGRPDVPQAKWQALEPGPTFLDDIECNASELDIGRAAERLRRPLLVVHGAQDLIVREAEARALAAKGDPASTELAIVPHASHTFGTDHPFTRTTPALELAIETTARFFLEHPT